MSNKLLVCLNCGATWPSGDGDRCPSCEPNNPMPLGKQPYAWQTPRTSSRGVTDEEVRAARGGLVAPFTGVALPGRG